MDKIVDIEFNERFEEFQDDYFRFIKTLDKDQSLIFSKELFKLNQLCMNPVKNLNAIEEFLITNDFNFDFRKYYGISGSTYSATTREPIRINEFVLFKKDFEQYDSDEKLIVKWTVAERMQRFACTVTTVLRLKIEELKSSNYTLTKKPSAIPTISIAYAIMFLKKGTNTKELDKTLFDQFSKNYGRTSGSIKSTYHKIPSDENSGYHRNHKPHIKMAISILPDRKSQDAGRNFLKKLDTSQ